MNFTDERAILLRTAEAVAKALGKGWEVEPDHEYVRGPGDERLYFRPAQPKRVEISALVSHLASREEIPYGVHGDKRSDWCITVAAADRGAEAIAREITRRLLPQHRAAIAATIAYRDQYRADKAAQNRAKAELPPWMKLPGRANATVKVQHGGREVDLELRSIPIDTARRIVAILQNLNLEA